MGAKSKPNLKRKKIKPSQKRAKSKPNLKRRKKGQKPKRRWRKRPKLVNRVGAQRTQRMVLKLNPKPTQRKRNKKQVRPQRHPGVAQKRGKQRISVKNPLKKKKQSKVK